MHILIENNALEYIKKHSENDEITIYVESRENAPLFAEKIAADLGKPRKDGDFGLCCVKDVDVYIENGIYAHESGIVVFSRSFLGIHTLEVAGAFVEKNGD